MPDGQIMTQFQVDAMAMNPPTGFLATVSVGEGLNFTVTVTSDGGVFVGPGAGESVGLGPVSFAAGATFGGPPSAFAESGIARILSGKRLIRPHRAAAVRHGPARWAVPSQGDGLPFRRPAS